MCAAKSLCKTKSRLPLRGALVPSGHRSALDQAGRRECHAKGMTERARPHRARARRGYLPGGAAGSIKQKEKRPWQTPLAFSL